MREFVYLSSLALCGIIFYGGFFWWLWLSIQSLSGGNSVMGMGFPAWAILTIAGCAAVLLLMYGLFCLIVGRKG